MPRINNIKFLYIVILSTIILSSVIVRYNDFANYPYHEDSFVTIRIIEQIAAGDIPFGDDSFLRAPLSQFLMAIPLYFVKGNEYTYRLANLGFSILLLVAVYFMGLAVKRPFIGLACAAFLGFSSFENIDITFIRFYFIFKYFFFVCVYYVFCFFVLKKQEVWGRLLLFLALLIFMHQLSMQIFVVIALAMIFSGKSYVLENRKCVCGIFAIAATCCLYHFGGNFSFYPRDYQEVQIIKVGTLYFSGNYFGLYDYFRDFVPLGWTMVFSGLALYPRSRDRNLLFLTISFLLLFLVTSALAISAAPRFISHLFPLGVFIALYALSSWTEILKESVSGMNLQKLAWCASPFLVLAVLTLCQLENLKNFRVFGRTATFPDQAEPHKVLLRNVAGNDLVMSVDPGLTEYYLRERVESSRIYFIRQKFTLETGLYSPFRPDIKIDRLIDEPAELNALIAKTGGTLWLYGNYKYQETVGPELRKIIDKHARLVTYYNEKDEIFVVALKK